MPSNIKLRPLEREDLLFVHQLNNNDSIMRYWFEEAYESFAELAQLYERNIHNQTERRFIVASPSDERVGLVELVEINHLHRSCEFQIAIHPAQSGPRLRQPGDADRDRLRVQRAQHPQAVPARRQGQTGAPVGIYESCGFQTEGILRDEFFVNGKYRDAVRMCLFQPEYLARRGGGDVAEPVLKT